MKTVQYDELTFETLKDNLESSGVARLQLNSYRARACRKILASFEKIEALLNE